MMPNPPLALRYTGNHESWTTSVPTRDMTADEVAGWHVPLPVLLEAGYLVPLDVAAARALGVWPLSTARQSVTWMIRPKRGG